MATNFFRTYVDDRSFIRGAGRLLVAPVTQAMPQKISDVIALAPASQASDVQTVSVTGGPPTSGAFTLSLNLNPGASSSVISGSIPYNVTATALQTTLQAMSNIGSGNVTCAGGPLPGTPIVCTFGGTLANEYIPTMTVASNALAGGTSPTPQVAHTTPGSPTLNLYDAQPGWSDLGATKNGITITLNNGEDTFDIDQQLTIIASQPNSWTCTVGTSLAESTPERMQVAWMGSTITVDNTPASGAEEQIGFGSPNYYIQRRIAVLFQRPSGLIRGYFFRIAQRSPQESSLVHSKTGDQQSIPVLFNCLADSTVTDVLSQLFIIRDQSIPSASNP